MDDFLTRLQLDIVGRLDSHPFFAEIPVLAQVKGDIESDIETALSVFNEKSPGKIGLVVIVLPPLADVPDPNVPGPVFNVLSAVRVLDQPSIRNIEVTGPQCCLYVHSAVHQVRFFPHVGQIFTDRRAIEPYDTGKDGVNGYDNFFANRFGIKAPDKVRRPQISGTASAVTITSETSGAQIYYTTDGSYPYVGNGEAELYTVPFTVDAGTEVRAGAYKDNMTPSDIASETIGA